MRMMKHLFWKGFMLPAAAVCALLIPIGAAQAALVNYSFTGSFDAPASPLLVSGSFQFESTTSGSSGVYNGAVKDFTLKFGPVGAPIYESSFISGANAVKISQDILTMSTDTIDRWELVSAANGGDLFGFTPLRFDLRFDVMNGNLSTSLQDPPSLGSLMGGSASWRLLFENGTRHPSAYLGSINSLTLATPLPAAVLLFGAGLISLVGLGAGGLRNFRESKA